MHAYGYAFLIALAITCFCGYKLKWGYHPKTIIKMIFWSALWPIPFTVFAWVGCNVVLFDDYSMNSKGEE